MLFYLACLTSLCLGENEEHTVSLHLTLLTGTQPGDQGKVCPLFSIYEFAFGLLCQILGHLVQERDTDTAGRPPEGT